MDTLQCLSDKIVESKAFSVVKVNNVAGSSSTSLI